MSTAAWLALLPLGLTASCSSTDEEATSAEALETGAGRWELPSDVRAAGARVHIPYEDAPAWSGGRYCFGSLRDGAQDLGRKLMDRFAEISSVGGYACRKNTADTSRMSVHGSGRALDVMIPTSAGVADEEAGDPIANWLVVNASAIGVQLIIWNHSMWRANGTNLVAYAGPNPHVNHIHVEITEAAARRRTAFFTNGAAVDLGDAGVDAHDPYDPHGDDATEGEDASFDEDGGLDDPYATNDPNDDYTSDDDPYATDPYADDSYAGDSFATDPYAADPYANDPSQGDPYATDPYATDPYGTDPYATGTNPPGTGAPGATTASGGARSDAAAPLPTPVVPRPYPAVADDSVGAPDSLGTGTRATPRTNAARKPPPQIETCAATPGAHPFGRATAFWSALAIGVALARRRQGASAR